MSSIQNISKTQIKYSIIIEEDSVSTDSSRQSTPSKHPIPKGSNPYAKAKREEFVYKNFEKAELLYLKAIKIGDRKVSAIKDLASLLNQRGRTQEAIDLLKKYKDLNTADQSSYKSLPRRKCH